MDMSYTFSQEELQEIERIKSRYPEAKAAIMPVLWLAQAKWGWISEDVMRTVATTLNLPLAHVKGVASFYTMYFKKPMGRYHIQVCTNVSCMLLGGDTIFERIQEKLGIGHNERTADGRFSLEEVECMGACGGAPMIAINEDYYENICYEDVERILASLP
ncbi:MAG: NADH-quinone oxidoreductase subunit NuoE [Bacteroidota bacterium]|nr:NADH-quinone oxidoreductase subunit NuoE [Candidatus Kapabacteria bacterium]MDW8219874.1 NADH-quinone oxidoreductase subunit NuoE [Bacteroidota bacterium]